MTDAMKVIEESTGKLHALGMELIERNRVLKVELEEAVGLLERVDMFFDENHGVAGGALDTDIADFLHEHKESK